MNASQFLRHLYAAALLVAAVSSGAANAQAASATRASTFAYDPVTGLLTKESVEPDTPNLCLETEYGYDVYGNRQTQTARNCVGAIGRAVFPTRAVATDTYAGFSITLQNAAGSSIAVTVPAGTYARTSANALSHGETRTVDPRFGTVVQLTGPNALSTTWLLDEFGRKVRETRSDGTYTEFFHCIIGLGLDTSSNPPDCSGSGLPVVTAPAEAMQFVHSQPRDAAGGIGGPFVRIFTDQLGREIRSAAQGFDGSGQSAGLVVTDVIYNEFGAKVVETQPYFNGVGFNSSVVSTPAPFGRTFRQYDILGRPIAVYVSDPATTDTVPMPAIPSALLNGRFTDTGGNAARTTITYNQFSVTTTNARGQATTQVKDPEGRVIWSEDAVGAQVAYLFDPLGNLLETRDGLGNKTQAEFDVRGRRTKLIDPNTGEWRYDYNALGELVWQESPKQRGASQATTMVYDAVGRMVTRTEPGDYITTWTYDKYANLAACSKGIGKLCEVTTSHGVNRRFTYDGVGRPLSTQTTLSGGINGGATRVFTSSVTYDSVKGRVSSQTYPTGVRVNLGYTPLGFTEQLTNNAGGALLWRAQRVNAWGSVERQLAGSNVQTRTSYQALTGRAADITAGVGSATNVINHSYAWDAVGNLKSRLDPIGSGSSAVSESFTYDALNRLTHYVVSGSAIPTGSRTVGLAYNAAGNILYKSDLGGYRYPANGSGTPRPNGVLELKPLNGGSVTYDYDANGSVAATTSTGTQPGYGAKYAQINYTSFNLPSGSSGLQGANGTTYNWQYDESHARIREEKAAPGGAGRVTWMLHPDKANGLAFEQEITWAGVSNRHYLMAGGQVIGVLTSAGEHTQPSAQTITKTEYWVRDHLGSSGATTDGSGSVTQRYAYDPWGQRRFTDGRNDPNSTLTYDHPAATDRGFTGHEHLDDVGVIHMNGRLYDARIGRFLQTDPFLRPDGGLQAFNRYSYVLNNPLNATDPTGEHPALYVAAAIVAFIAYKEPSFRPLASIVVGALLAPYTGGMSLEVAAQAAFAGFASGATATGNLRGGVQGAGTALVFFGAGQAANAIAGSFVEAGLSASSSASSDAFFNAAGAFEASGGVGRVALHAAAGCASAAISGGDCGRGALTAGLTKAMAGNLPSGDAAGGVIKYSVIGGTVNAIGGGKFANGAMMGAFQYLFNDAVTEAQFQALESKSPLGGFYRKFLENILASPAAMKEVEESARVAASRALSNAATTTGGAAAAVGSTQVLKPIALPMSIGSTLLDISATAVAPNPNWSGTAFDILLDNAVQNIGSAAGVPPIIMFGITEGMKRSPEVQQLKCPPPKQC